MRLPTLYAIIDADVLKSRNIELIAFATQLRAAGVSLLQYRHKTGTPRDILRNAAAIAEIFAGTDCTLIFNDRADLAALAGWHGVHVGQHDLSPEDAREVMLRGPGAASRLVVGVSTHTAEQVIAADTSSADYIAIGPIFATGTKSDAEAAVGLDGIRRARDHTRKPLVAIGGIHLQNAQSVLDAGADSVAVISALIEPGKSPEDIAREFCSLRLAR